MDRRTPIKIEEILLGGIVQDIPKLIPGLFLAFLVWYVSERFSGFLGQTVMGFKTNPISTIMITIVFGILIRNCIGLHSIFVPGIAFCLKKLLRLGIILLGIRLSFPDVLRIGAVGVPIVALCVATGLFISSYAARIVRLSETLGVLIAVGTGICGASAIVATAPAIGATDEEVSYAVANITVFGILAMFLYPYLAEILFTGNRILAGIFLGTSIHETSQVLGSAIIYDQQTSILHGVSTAPIGSPLGSDIALVTKLTRNAFMILAIPIMAFYYRRKNCPSDRKVNLSSYFPFFILGFLLMALLRSLGEMTMSGPDKLVLGIIKGSAWRYAIAEITKIAGVLLAATMAGVGLGTSFHNLKRIGIRPFLIGLLACLGVGIVSVGAVFIFGPSIKF